MTNLDTSIGEAFIRYARHELSESYLPKIQRCLELLNEEDVWWRAHETNNSIGNLLLHLSGNVRQWIISGLGGKEDLRNRPAEFAARGSYSKQELLQGLVSTIREADQTLASFDTNRLLEKRTIQGFDVTCLDVIFHVVEHCSGHVGQIVFVTKYRTGEDLKFYNL